VGGCAANDQSLAIVHFVALEANMCVADPTSMNIRGRGIIDVGAVKAGASGYVAAPVVQNLLPADTTSTGVDVNGMFVKAFDVKINDSRVPGGFHNFRQPVAAGYLASGGTNRAAASFEILPREAVIGLTGLNLVVGALPSGPPIVVSVRPVVTRASLELVGAYVDFPIDVCDGCVLFNAGTCLIDPTSKLSVAPATGTNTKESVCNRAQDHSTACCTATMPPGELCSG